ncbi:exonuclease domain-containing protein [Sphingobacterium sp. 1.A.5]|uniref:3'-5' exonuclease n=1 Tax=Sphingobacterium sp. 1.A.5 TaxID=2044604 RepID=UPI000C0C0551|nr:exonuclease domain-containing protein [Sphingobacterium sp. 1.A.5]
MAKILFYDLETTGTMFWKNGIHQLSGILEIDGEVKETFNFKMRPNPNAIIDDGSLKVANVTIEVIQNYDLDMKQGYDKFISLLSTYVNKYDKKDKIFLCGFRNTGFDDPFLNAFFKQNGDDYSFSWFWSNSLDVNVLATQELKEIRQSLKDFKLSTVAETLGIEVDHNNLHDALYDVELTRLSYHKLCKVQ